MKNNISNKIKGRAALAFVGLLSLSFLFLGGTSGCGSATSSSDSSSGGTTTASTATLSSVPSVDISNLDVSQSSSSSSKLEVAALKANGMLELPEADSSTDATKGLAQNKAAGDSSRAGCEADSQKKEMIRHSQQAQLERCYPEAMESAGLITIPTGSSAFYSITPPDDSKEQRKKGCDGIPADHKDEKAACQNGEGPGTNGILLKIGRSADGKELDVDMCEGKEGSAKLANEGTYSTSGSKYTTIATHCGSWGGNNECGALNMTVDLGTTGKVSDGLVTLGDGTGTADANMSGGFGSGTMHFQALGSDSSNILSGIFKASFIDTRANVTNSFTGKTYAHFNANSGCAKFSFTGSPPPMPVKSMVPFDIPDSNLDNFLKSFGQQLGIVLTKTNYATVFLCPNSLNDPDNPSTSVAPMVQAVAGSPCASQTHTGVECFSITNGSSDGNFGEKKIKQTYLLIDNSKSSYYTEVNAFDLSKLTASSDKIAFTRNWDCTGTFTPVNFTNLTQDQGTKIIAGIQKCQALEEKARDNEGMGGHNCDQKEQQRGVDKFAQNGPPPPGKFDGACQLKTAGNTCQTGATRPTYFFNGCGTKECFQAPGAAQEFTITGTSSGAVKLYDSTGKFCVTQIDFTQPGGDTTKPATSAHLAIKTGVTDSNCSGGTACAQDCDMTAPPTFDKPPAQGGGTPTGGGTPPPPPTGGGAPGQQGFVPKYCTTRNLTGNACRDACHSPDVDCRS